MTAEKLFVSAIVMAFCLALGSCAEPEESVLRRPYRGNARFYLYADASDPLRREELIPGDLEGLRQSHYNASRPVKILIHGYLQIWYLAQMIYPWSTKNAYLKHGPECNVIIVDYLGVRGFWTYFVATNVGMQEVMDGGVKLLAWLHNLGMIDLKATHISGFSLGAPMAAAIALGVYNATGIKLGRLTGLDPAGPGFAPRIPFLRVRHCISPEDADFVDIVHTNGANFGLGTTRSAGHVDFYVNGGKEQPNCRLLPYFCSHILAPYYFEQSIRTRDREKRCACYTLGRYTADPGCCDTRLVFGEYTNHRMIGTFYITYNVDVGRALLGMLDKESNIREEELQESGADPEMSEG